MNAETYKLFYSENKLKDVRDKIEEDIKEINEIMKRSFKDNCIVVILSPNNKSDEEEYKTTRIHIFRDFLKANPLLNKEQRIDGQRISILQYDLRSDKFLFLMVKDLKSRRFKTFDKRQVESMFNDLGFESRIMFLYNHNKTIIKIHK